MSWLKVIKKRKTLLILLGLLFATFLVRVFLVKFFIPQSGDLLLYADWAEKYWQYGAGDFYLYPKWYYAPPNYPPALSLIYAAAYWLFEHKYLLAQLHNIIRIPPAFFIVYFYEFGLYLTLKLPGILADLGLGVLIFLVIKSLTGKLKKAFIGASFYLFNPVSIFLSGVWGQTDSLVTFLGLTSFITLWKRMAWLSIPLMFLSFYLKPNWGIFIPLYIFLFILKKPQVKQIISGMAVALVLFWITTKPFSGGEVLSFSKWLWGSRLLPTATVAHKASVSAFNFHSIVYTLDRTLETDTYLGISARTLGYILFVFLNVLAFRYIKKQKTSLVSIFAGIFTIGFGSYLFLTNMLERYFFASFVPMIILMFTNPRVLVWGVIINLVVFVNLLHSFFRRSWGALADAFEASNFLLVRIFSLINLALYTLLTKKLIYSKK
jgi:hypothetical protein